MDGIRVSASSDAEKVLGAESETWRTFVAAEVYHGWIHLCTVEWIQGRGWGLSVQGFYVGDVSRGITATITFLYSLQIQCIGLCSLHLGDIDLFISSKDKQVHQREEGADMWCLFCNCRCVA